MKFRNLIALVAMVASLASCSLDEDTFNKARPMLRQRPDAQADITAKCVRRLRYERMEFKRYLAGFLHTRTDGIAEKFCGRMMRGYLSGRMRFEDLDLVMRRQKFTPNMVAILRAG